MQKKFFWAIGVIIIIIAAVGAFLANSGNQATVATAKSDVKKFNINASQYYFDPNIISVSRGDKVKITINNLDVLHGINILELGVSGNEVVEFTADKKGEFVWYCNNYCGDGHRRMQGRLIVQ